MSLFHRYVAVDWSGAGAATDGVDIAVVEAGRAGAPAVVPPSSMDGRARKRWSRDACEAWLAGVLASDAPTLVLVDAGFAYPSGAARAMVSATDWRALVKEIAALYRTHGTARAVATAINARFPDGAPFRFNEARADARWYARHHVAYYRQAELLVPQAISELYFGSGAVVGYHTVTLLAALDAMIARREKNELAFDVWPFEIASAPRGHVLVECYPALCRASLGAPKDTRLNAHEADAMVACTWARDLDARGGLAPLFDVREVPIGRDTRVTWQAQIREEGWIFGVPFGR